jgi:hypothetical protein
MQASCVFEIAVGGGKNEGIIKKAAKYMQLTVLYKNRKVSQ